MSESDSVLWAQSRAGDARAFEHLFRRNAKPIYNYCFRRTGNWGVAEDLVSVVFLEAWRQRHRSLPPESVVPWLFGIANNVVRNRRRAERRYASALRRIPPPRPEPGLDETIERLGDEREMTEILALVGKLPRRQQEVLSLCVLSELSYEDAAVALSIPIGTVRSRLARARQRLVELARDAGHEFGKRSLMEEVAEL